MVLLLIYRSHSRYARWLESEGWRPTNDSWRSEWCREGTASDLGLAFPRQTQFELMLRGSRMRKKEKALRRKQHRIRVQAIYSNRVRLGSA